MLSATINGNQSVLVVGKREHQKHQQVAAVWTAKGRIAAATYKL